MSYLFHNLLHFSRLLHSAGLDVHAGRMPDVAAALEHIDIKNRSDFYFTLRTLLIHRHQDLEAFDEAFRVFWRPRPDERSALDLRALGEKRRFSNPQVDFPARHPDTGETDPSLRTLSEVVDRIAPLSYSSREVSRTKDFAEFTEHELQQAKAMLDDLRWHPELRHTRRWIPGPGAKADLRRTIRENMRYGGELLKIPTQIRKEKRRPFILLCDISGSMERYSRMLLHFMHTLTDRMDRVEAFLFATRLTRITRELAGGKSSRGADDAILKISRQVSDWSGGTRIGGAFRAFNVNWARRTLAHGSVVLVISDGWDRGDPELLRQEIGRLRRTCYRLIWLNPLLGSPDYQPLTRGMRAALPFVDDFLPVHNLESLEALAAQLNSLGPRRRTKL